MLLFSTPPQILNLSPITICQDSQRSEDCSCFGESEPQVIRKGKSCLFALPHSCLSKPVSSFPVQVTVYKKLPANVLPDVMLIGCCPIEAKDLINAPGPSQSLKNTFKIRTSTGQCVGNLSLFLRLSRFGNRIITKIHVPPNAENKFLYKGLNDNPVMQCKKVVDCPESSPVQNCVCDPSAKDEVEVPLDFTPEKICCDVEPVCREQEKKKTRKKKSCSLRSTDRAKFKILKSGKQCGCDGD